MELLCLHSGQNEGHQTLGESETAGDIRRGDSCGGLGLLKLVSFGQAWEVEQQASLSGFGGGAWTASVMACLIQPVASSLPAFLQLNVAGETILTSLTLKS